MMTRSEFNKQMREYATEAIGNRSFIFDSCEEEAIDAIAKAIERALIDFDAIEMADARDEDRPRNRPRPKVGITTSAKPMPSRVNEPYKTIEVGESYFVYTKRRTKGTSIWNHEKTTGKRFEFRVVTEDGFKGIRIWRTK